MLPASPHVPILYFRFKNRLQSIQRLRQLGFDDHRRVVPPFVDKESFRTPSTCLEPHSGYSRVLAMCLPFGP